MQTSSTAAVSGNPAGTETSSAQNPGETDPPQIRVDQETADDNDDNLDDTSPQTSQICPDFAIGKCQHGSTGQKEVNGIKCTLQHPKKCKKYCRHGSKGQHGCKKGDKCEYYHPKLCMNSVRKRVCTKKDCKLVHLINTSRKPKPKEKAAKPNANSTQTGSTENNSHDFLELKSLIENMRTNFQNEISSIKMGLMNQQPKVPVPMMLPWVQQPQLLNQYLHQYPMFPGGTGVNIPPVSC